MKIKINLLTPLWTGGVDRQTDRIRETGILGSLRWWYEAVVRGPGKKACDPGKGKCSFDARAYNQSKAEDERQRLRDAGLCDVCQIFGATGWKRRFRLEIIEDNTRPIWTPLDKMINIRPYGRTRGWYLPPGRMGTFSLNISGDPGAVSLMAAFMLFLEKHGSIGAKPQLGYGFFQILNKEDIQNEIRKSRWEEISGSSAEKHNISGLPDLQNFLFFSYSFCPAIPGWWTRVPGISRVASYVQKSVSIYKIVPVAPALKNEWRFNQWQKKWGDDRDIFGAIRPDRKRSRIAISWAYRLESGEWKIKGWAWLPSQHKSANALREIVAQENIWKKIIGVRGDLKIYSERILKTGF
jgi:CRISPR-associated protein Cmr1